MVQQFPPLLFILFIYLLFEHRCLRTEDRVAEAAPLEEKLPGGPNAGTDYREECCGRSKRRTVIGGETF